MSRAIAVVGKFGLESLTLVDREDLPPRRGEIAIRVRAASINYRDLLMVRGQYNPRQPLPFIPLSDGVGEITELGEGVQAFALGERVSPIFAQGYLAGEPTKEKLATTLGGPLDGVLRERMIVPADSVVRVPSGMSAIAAATLPCAAVTAWSALVEQGGLTVGQTVVVQGTGGVSIAALQIAKAMGARVIVTSSSDVKLARAQALGADRLINYKTTPQWGREVLRLTADRGADFVVEVGGAGTLAESLRAVRPGGIIAIIGVLSAAVSEVNVLPILMRNVRLQGVFVGHKEASQRMIRAYETLRIEPVVDRVFPWTSVASALEYLATGAHFGKVCLEF
jgi:NADPH:quinone reductase-like Zn-dependent oxidoreductase